jgi:hypothetical protein
MRLFSQRFVGQFEILQAACLVAALLRSGADDRPLSSADDQLVDAPAPHSYLSATMGSTRMARRAGG